MPSFAQLLPIFVFICAFVLEVEAKKGGGGGKGGTKTRFTVGTYTGAAVGAVAGLTVLVMILVLWSKCKAKRRTSRSLNLIDEDPEKIQDLIGRVEESDTKVDSDKLHVHAVDDLSSHRPGSSKGPQYPVPAYIVGRQAQGYYQESPLQVTV